MAERTQEERDLIDELEYAWAMLGTAHTREERKYWLRRTDEASAALHRYRWGDSDRRAFWVFVAIMGAAIALVCAAVFWLASR